MPQTTINFKEFVDSNVTRLEEQSKELSIKASFLRELLQVFEQNNWKVISDTVDTVTEKESVITPDSKK